jgi:cysteine desulfurase
VRFSQPSWNFYTNMPSATRLYLDHAATTPVITAAQDAYVQGVMHWANPSSPHSEGRAARAALENARTRVASALGWDGEVFFTSGSSEAIGIGLRGVETLASRVEHDAVLAAAGKAIGLPVDANGMVILKEIRGAARYAIQSVNSETGVIQDLEAVAEAIRAQGGIWFADCSQSAGKMPLPNADIICVSAHKLGGPPGVGALLVRNLRLLSPSGGQEKGYRRGTENLPAALGFAAALEAGFGWMERAAGLRAMLDLAITEAGGKVVAARSPRIATIASYHMPGVSSSSQLIGFDMEGIAVSAGSACSSGTLKTSHVLGAMGWGIREASEVIRVSFGPDTNAGDIERFAGVWRAIKGRAKSS